jgi:hypothetical protein
VPDRAFTAGKRPAGRHDTMCVVASSSSVAMIGGGQVARMTHPSAIALGRTLRCWPPGQDQIIVDRRLLA